MKAVWKKAGLGAAALLVCWGLVACGAKQADPEAGLDPAAEQMPATAESAEESAGTVGATDSTGATPPPANTSQTVPPPTVVPFSPGSTGGAPATATAPKMATGEQAAYDQALSLYHQKRFSEGEKAFSAFIEAHPSSKLLPNALYWRAECLYARGLFADAVFGFKEVISRFAKHPKAADALLKAAMSYARLKDQDNVALHLAILKEDFPNSAALQRARELKLLP